MLHVSVRVLVTMNLVASATGGVMPTHLHTREMRRKVEQQWHWFVRSDQLAHVMGPQSSGREHQSCCGNLAKIQVNSLDASDSKATYRA